MSLSEANRLIVLVCYNCSRSLYLEKRYEECIEIANVGWEVSIRLIICIWQCRIKVI